MKLPLLIIITFIEIIIVCANPTIQINVEDERNTIIANIVSSNLKANSWNTILCMGHFPDTFYDVIKRIPFALVVTNVDIEDLDIEDIVPYHSNTIIISCFNFTDYEETIRKIITSPYWHPLANIILIYHTQDKEVLPKLFFSLWYYKAVNAIIVQYDDVSESLLISVYTPYSNDNYKLDHNLGCRTARKIGMPVLGFEDGFVCEDTCKNVSVVSKYRAENLGTCIGYNTIAIPYNDSIDWKTLNLFEDKGKNLHSFPLRAFTTEVEPFLLSDVYENGTCQLRARDGMIWNTLGSLMNFTLDLNATMKYLKERFNFEVNIKQIFSVAHRKGDVYLIPIYLFDVIVVELDNTFPYKDSGVCIMSHRADFETALFNVNTLQTHYGFIIQVISCFLCIWLIFAIYKGVEKGELTCDQIGKDLVNAFRNVLLITLYNPPKRSSFRIFLTISIWGFFIISFGAQATIISFFTALKRGKEVETFEDVIEKGYVIEGISSPDLILPDTEERFRKINSKLVPVQDLFECIRNMNNDSRRFCLVDCSVGRYIERNRLNENGEQYLHIAKDRIHSHYLNIILGKHSPLTDQVNKYLMRFFEAGLIKQWEQYRFTHIKDEVPAKPLGMSDVKGLFDAYCLGIGFTVFVFIVELLIHYVKKIPRVIAKCKSCGRVG